MDGAGNIYRNAMAYSGRPTHYFDFSTSQWKPIPNNHVSNNLALNLGNWKAQEYAWHARQAGVTIYTVGYGSSVDATECGLLADVANAVSVVSPNGIDANGNPTTTTNANNYIAGPARRPAVLRHDPHRHQQRLLPGRHGDQRRADPVGEGMP